MFCIMYAIPATHARTPSLSSVWMSSFRECLYSGLTLTELRFRMQTIVDACGCHASKQSDRRIGGQISSLPIPYCTNSFLFISSTAYLASAAMIVA